MSIQNIYDILHSLKGSQSPIVGRLVAELGKRCQGDFEFVDYDLHDSVVYRYASRNTEANPLLDACSSHHNLLRFQFNSLWTYFKDIALSIMYRKNHQHNIFRLSDRKEATRDDIKRLLG